MGWQKKSPSEFHYGWQGLVDGYVRYPNAAEGKIYVVIKERGRDLWQVKTATDNKLDWVEEPLIAEFTFLEEALRYTDTLARLE